MVKAFVKRTKDLFSRGRNTKEGPASSTSQTPPEDAKNTLEAQDDSSAVAPVTIVGAGIVGLVLALALDKHCGIKAELYEQAQAFHDDVGAGMGMYPNGLRVIRDISPELLQAIQEAGYAYVLRRYEVCHSYSIVLSRVLSRSKSHRCFLLYSISRQCVILLPIFQSILVIRL
jgi:ribulose 1,5-bisphosphate synthetase/thiazole synthase